MSFWTDWSTVVSANGSITFLAVTAVAALLLAAIYYATIRWGRRYAAAPTLHECRLGIETDCPKDYKCMYSSALKRNTCVLDGSQACSVEQGKLRPCHFDGDCQCNDSAPWGCVHVAPLDFEVVSVDNDQNFTQSSLNDALHGLTEGTVLPVRLVIPSDASDAQREADMACHADGVSVRVTNVSETNLALELHDLGTGLAQCFAKHQEIQDPSARGDGNAFILSTSSVLTPFASIGPTGYKQHTRSMRSENKVLEESFTIREDTGKLVLYYTNKISHVTLQLLKISGTQVDVVNDGAASQVNLSFVYKIDESEPFFTHFPKGTSIMSVSHNNNRATLVMSQPSIMDFYGEVDSGTDSTIRFIGRATTPTEEAIAEFATTAPAGGSEDTRLGQWKFEDKPTLQLRLIATTPYELQLEPAAGTAQLLDAFVSHKSVDLSPELKTAFSNVGGIMFRSPPGTVVGDVSGVQHPIRVSLSGMKEDVMYNYTSQGTHVTIPPSSGGNGWCLPKIRIDSSVCTPATGGMTVLTDERGGVGFTCVCKEPGMFTQDARGHDCVAPGQGLCTGGVFRVRAKVDQYSQHCAGTIDKDGLSSIPVVCPTAGEQTGYAYFDLKTAAKLKLLTRETMQDPYTGCHCAGGEVSKRTPGDPPSFECVANSCSPGELKGSGTAQGCVCPFGFITNKLYVAADSSAQAQPFPKHSFDSGPVAGPGAPTPSAANAADFPPICVPDTCAVSVDSGQPAGAAAFRDGKWICECDLDQGFTAFNDPAANTIGMKSTVVSGSCNKPCDFSGCGKNTCQTCYQLRKRYNDFTSTSPKAPPGFTCGTTQANDPATQNANSRIPVCTKCDCPHCNSFTNPQAVVNVTNVKDVNEATITLNAAIKGLEPGYTYYYPSSASYHFHMVVKSVAGTSIKIDPAKGGYPDEVGCQAKTSQMTDQQCALVFRQAANASSAYSKTAGKNACTPTVGCEFTDKFIETESTKTGGLLFYPTTATCVIDRDGSIAIGKDVFGCTGFRPNIKMVGEICDPSRTNNCCDHLTCTSINKSFIGVPVSGITNNHICAAPSQLW